MLYVCDLPKNIFEAATKGLKKTFKPSKKNPDMKENLC